MITETNYFKNPMPMRLSYDKRYELEALAAKSRLISSIARLVYLRGIAAIQAD
ncbi:hypothetical protein [Yersinia intermedia]|uniref:hypothetical protein n=1 Tax=Yersinia intermedia TaxID=631 RepID=UPI001CFE76BB|nr:hypothetical protein [Yersinia intermedia]MCB5314191.1 hypothetical protein [Yersinia intermedia]MCB5328045.1 hypothetical protein [Yersinia intermedia]